MRWKNAKLNLNANQVIRQSGVLNILNYKIPVVTQLNRDIDYDTVYLIIAIKTDQISYEMAFP